MDSARDQNLDLDSSQLTNVTISLVFDMKKDRLETVLRYTTKAYRSVSYYEREIYLAFSYKYNKARMINERGHQVPLFRSPS